MIAPEHAFMTGFLNDCCHLIVLWWHLISIKLHDKRNFAAAYRCLLCIDSVQAQWMPDLHVISEFTLICHALHLQNVFIHMPFNIIALHIISRYGRMECCVFFSSFCTSNCIWAFFPFEYKWINQDWLFAGSRISVSKRGDRTLNVSLNSSTCTVAFFTVNRITSVDRLKSVALTKQFHLSSKFNENLENIGNVDRFVWRIRYSYSESSWRTQNQDEFLLNFPRANYTYFISILHELIICFVFLQQLA